jgi:vancomycin resistance protein VanJ
VQRWILHHVLLALRSAAWLFGATVLAGVALRFSIGDASFITRYTGYVMPWLLVALVPGAVWAWVTRSRALSAILGASSVLILAVHVPAFRRHQPPAPESETRLTVMSYNTWSSNHDDRRIAGVVLRHAPDLLLLQETPPEVFERLLANLRDLYGGSPVHWAHESAILQAVISRHPLESSVSMEEKGNAQKVVVLLPEGPVTVFNVHPLRSGGWRHRYGQIASLIEEDVLHARTPVILGGDFNSPEHSQLYRYIAGRLANAHREAGFGFGFTYPSSAVRWLDRIPAFPMVRIDHIFFDERFVAIRAGTIEDSGGSDHRPVFAELALTGEAPHLAPGGASGAPDPFAKR